MEEKLEVAYHSILNHRQVSVPAQPLIAAISEFAGKLLFYGCLWPVWPEIDERERKKRGGFCRPGSLPAGSLREVPWQLGPQMGQRQHLRVSRVTTRIPPASLAQWKQRLMPIPGIAPCSPSTPKAQSSGLCHLFPSKRMSGFQEPHCW